MIPDVWAKIDLGAIKHNYNYVKSRVSKETGIIAVVKSNAYGHGLEKTAEALVGEGCEFFAVTSVDEAVNLRQRGISQAILNLSYTDATAVEEMINRRLVATVYDEESALVLHEAAAVLHKPLKIHIKIDTGMSRLGILPDDVMKIVPQLFDMPYFRVEGMYSHFADESDMRFVEEQYQKMQSVLFSLQKAGRVVPAVHMAKSGVLFKSTKYHFDAVRPGMALFGHKPEGKNLIPALSLMTKLAQVKRVQKGSKIGYMQTFRAPMDMTIGILPMGYAHGFDRGLSNKGYVLVDGWRCPVIGRVCMAQTIVDLSPVRSSSRLQIGQEVVVIGKQTRNEITVVEIAQLLDTNTYEVVARIPESVHREYIS